MKPHRGTLKNWHRREAFGGGYVIVGISHGHPDWHGHLIHTSGIVAERPEINEVETRNSRYSLELPALSEAPPSADFITEQLKPGSPVQSPSEPERELSNKSNESGR